MMPHRHISLKYPSNIPQISFKYPSNIAPNIAPFTETHNYCRVLEINFVGFF